VTTAPETLEVERPTYPVVLPKLSDPRLHVAAIIITIHVLGQTELRFHVTVPQILASILTCALMEVAITFRRQRAFVWPASAMLTGSGVALILRVPSTPVGDHWSFHAWWVFAAVGAFSLSTKYLVRYKGSHVFNPSNVGLVVVFIVFGSTRLEPLDFWWAPLGTGMIVAYAVILIGGLLITARLGLLAAAVTFWLTLAAGLGILAASGHSMVARWAFAPVSGFDYWRVIMFSPEVLIFLFFMITDPKTVPSSRGGRVAFFFLVAVTSTLLMAPQTTEFGTKVALLGGLALVCAARPILDRLELEKLAIGRGMVLRAAVFAVLAALLSTAIVAAGAPARGTVDPAAAEVLGRVPHDVDPATFPSITVGQDVVDWNHEITGAGAREIVLMLAENLLLESQAVRRNDVSILEAVDHGDRLDEMSARLEDDEANGTSVVERYRIDDVKVVLLPPFGKQEGISLGLESRGTVTAETYDDSGTLTARTSSPFAKTFVMRRATGGRWLNVAALPISASAS
jgi:Na+-translocating ferredoxin:NAD+ oxidoreductase RnfD subunit